MDRRKRDISYDPPFGRELAWLPSVDVNYGLSFAASSNIISDESHQLWSFKSWIVLETEGI